jgi:hypothetical protein
MVDPRAARGFAGAVAAYERGRPPYPAAAVGWLARELGVTPAATVLDLAAGTGKLSRAARAAGRPGDRRRPVAGCSPSCASASPRWTRGRARPRRSPWPTGRSRRCSSARPSTGSGRPRRAARSPACSPPEADRRCCGTGLGGARRSCPGCRPSAPSSSRCRARRTRTRPRARGGARRSTRAACSRRCRERTPTTSTGSPPTTSSPSWPPRAGSRTCPATGVTRCSHGCGRSSPAGRRSRCATAPGCTDAGPAGGGQAREPAPQKNGPAVCRTVMSQPSRRRRSSRSAGRCATFTIRCAVPSLSRRRKTTS